MAETSALEYLASAYEEMGYKVVAQALRAHGANAEKFKIEVRAIESAMSGTREQDATIAEQHQRDDIAAAIRRTLQRKGHKGLWSAAKGA